MTDCKESIESGKVIESQQLVQLVNWLEEQRRQDKEMLIHLEQETERFLVQSREVGAQLREISEELRVAQECSTQLSLLDETVRQLQERVTVMEQRTESASQNRDKTMSMLQTESARTQATLGELSQSLASIERQEESLATKLKLLGHESQSDRSALVEATRKVESMASRLESAVGKIQLLEELIRKNDGRYGTMERDIDLLKAEQEQRVQWEKVADLRWSRQSAEYQGKTETWQKAMDEQNRMVQHFARQLQEGADGIQSLYRRLSDGFQENEEQKRELRRLDIWCKSSQEDTARLQQLIDENRSKLDEQTNYIRQLEVAVRLREDREASLQRALEVQNERLEALVTALSQSESKQRSQMLDITDAQERGRMQLEGFGEKLNELRQLVDEQGERTKVALTHLRQVEEQRRVRELTQLQREIQDLRVDEA